MTDRYAVIGNPVEHSKSPLIHAAFARQTGQDLEYGRILAPLNGFAECVQNFRAAGGRGANVTVPFKEVAYRLATGLSTRAHDAGAVNTLTFDGEAILGDNTDGVGLVRDITVNLGFDLAGRRVLLMGAGGAARGVIRSLLECRPGLLVVANRTVTRAEELARHFGGLVASGYPELAGKRFDLIINATSTSLADTMPPLPAEAFGTGALAYDMFYGCETPFMRFARLHGARTADGLGMLVEQAAESFYIWREVRPKTQPVIAMLRGS